MQTAVMYTKCRKHAENTHSLNWKNHVSTITVSKHHYSHQSLIQLVQKGSLLTYLQGALFQSWPGHRPPSVRFSVFLIYSKQMPR